MSATPNQRRLFGEKPDLAIGPVETYFPQLAAEVNHPSETVEQNPLDNDTDPVIQRLAVRARVISISGPCFLDEVVQLDRLYQQEDPVRVRHWIFESPTCYVTDLSYNSEPGLGFDGRPRHLARAHFDIELIETASTGE